MKKINYIFALLACASLFTVTGCNLDIAPSDSLTGDQMNASPTGLTDIINGCYTVFKDFQEGQGGNNWYLRQYYHMGDFPSDDIVYGHETEDNLNMCFRYPQRTASLDNFTTFWTNSYKIIYAANTAYDVANRAETKTDDDKHIIGEALFLKAYAMHELVRLYAKPYTQSNPTTDLGIILRESSTDTDNKDRATLQDTYDYIVKCLLEAETIMDGVTSTRDDAKGFASIWAVRAELSRVYLYMGNWEKAKEYASKVINSNKFKLETTSDIPGYVADAENASETVWCITMIAADDKESASVASMIMTEGDGCWGEEGYSPSLLEAMGMGTNDEEADVRFKFVQDPAIKNGLTLYPCSKYSWQNGKKTCASPILIRYAEMYFNRAEAEANLGDATSALADINAVREQRIDPSAVAGTTMSDYLYKASDITSSTTALDLVMKEKRIEFCFECQRFFDLMRYGKDIVRNYWGFHILTYAAGQSTSSLPGLNVDQVVTKATYPKLIYPIPEQETNNNPKCTQNAGY